MPSPINPWTACFRDKSVEFLYEDEIFRQRRFYVLGIVSVIIFAGGLNLINELKVIDFDYYNVKNIVSLRIFIFLVGIIAILGAWRSRTPQSLDLIVALYGMFCILVSQYINSIHPSFSEMGPVSIVVTVLLIYLMAPARFLIVTGLALYASVGLWMAWAVWRENPPPPGSAFRMVLFLVVINLVGLLTANNRNRRDRLLFAQNRAMAAEVAEHKRTAEALRRQETALIEARQRAEQSLAIELATMDEYRRFISVITHEFRNPLAIIRSHTQLAQLQTDRAEPDIQPSLSAIRRAVERLQGMFETWLQAGGIPDQALVPKMRPLSVRALFEQLDRQAAAPTTVTVTIRPPEPDLEVEADLSLILLAMLNLVDNAGKYSPPGRSVSVSAGRTADWVVLRVEDQGHGISIADQTRIFEAGYRGAHAAGTTGSGFGLFLVNQIVSAHGGKLTLASTEGKGSVFTVWLATPSVADGRHPALRHDELAPLSCG